MENQKQILIIGGDNGGGSAGDQLMCEAACYFFIRHNYIVYTDAQSISWKSPIKGVNTIVQLRKDVYNNIYERIFKSMLKLYRIFLLPYVCKTKVNIPFFLHGNAFKSCLQKCNVVLFAGCGGLTDKYGINILMWKSIVKSAKRLRIPIYISGVGIGPLSSKYNIRNVKYILNNVDYVTVRDYLLSLDITQKLCLTKRYTWVPDDACFYNGFETYKLPSNNKKKRIGLSIMSSFRNTLTYSLFIECLQHYFSKDDITIYLISVTHEDYDTLLEISHKVSNSILLPRLSPSATKNVISQLDLMISSRYHGCVFALSQGVPVIGIYNESYWKEKIKGVLSMFDFKDSVYAFNDICSSDLFQKSDEMLKNLNYYRNNLFTRKQTLKEKAYYVHNIILNAARSLG